MSGIQRKPLNKSPEDEELMSATTPSFPQNNSQLPTSPTTGELFGSKFFRHSGYHHMNSHGGQELIDLTAKGSEPQLPELSQLPTKGRHGTTPEELSMWNDVNFKEKRASTRVPVGSKVMSPQTPRFDDETLASPGHYSITSPAFTYGGSPQYDRDDASYQGLLYSPPIASSVKQSPGKHISGSYTRPFTVKHSAWETPETMSTCDREIYDDQDEFYGGYNGPPNYCESKRKVTRKRADWLSVTIYALSIYSTILSGLWLVVAFVQPRWGHKISTSAGLDPSTATTLFALLAKTIEMSFVTVFVAFIGQVLTRRSLAKKSSGMTLGEMTMRNWVIQPGSLITHAETVTTGAFSVLGMLALTATLAAAFYTTASDSMVSPKLKYGAWESKYLSGYMRTSYANISYQKSACPNLFEVDQDNPNACIESQFSGQSYQNLLGFLTRWDSIRTGDGEEINDLSRRPAGTHLLDQNTTMYGAWIEKDTSNVTVSYNRYNRIVNNVTLAMPHPGVYHAATDPVNKILQPKDLGDVGGYSVRAGVVSPSINAMCVEMTKGDLEPLIYTEWPYAQSNRTGVGNQTTGHEGWDDEVPPFLGEDGEINYLNKTDVDDVFRWGEKYGRNPPVFQLYPFDFNMVVNSTVSGSDAIYILVKPQSTTNYTMCELRSWVSPKCSTNFDISGTSGSFMKAHCEDDRDENAYWRSFETGQEWPPPSLDWRDTAGSWRLSMHLNGGTKNDNASNAHILTQLALTEPALPANLPSLAEALAVYATSSIVSSAIGTPFKHWWGHLETLTAPGELQSFNASLRTQEYTSGHNNDWQTLFYVVLVLLFGINVTCVVYFLFLSRLGMVTDFTEPQNMFALAVNSPPSVQLNGSCGGGPQGREIVVPWRVAWAETANHYFFTEANDGPWRGKHASKTGKR